jgi:hypothetical protein
MPNFDPQDYVQVNERLEKFRADHPLWALESQLLHHDDKTFIVRAVVTNEEGRIIATGLAEEIRGQGMVNKTSPLENCETSAWGRALANLGYEVRRSIASREEMEKAQRTPAVPGGGQPETGGPAAESAATPPPSGDRLQERRVACISMAQQLIACGTPDHAARREQLLAAMAAAGLPNDFGSFDELQCDAFGAIINNLSGPF